MVSLKPVLRKQSNTIHSENMTQYVIHQSSYIDIQKLTIIVYGIARLATSVDIVLYTLA